MPQKIQSAAVFSLECRGNKLKPLPVLAPVSRTGPEPGAGGAEAGTAEAEAASCLALCLLAGTSSKGNFAT